MSKLLRWVFIATTIAAFGLRVAWLDQQGLWSDEFLTLARAQMSSGELLRVLPIEHVPLYFTLMHGWVALVGSSDFALRFFSVAWDILALALLFRLGRRLFGAPTGLLATLLFAVNPFQVWYSQEARMYTQLTALSLAALCTLDVGLTMETGDKRPSVSRARPLAWFAYVVAVTLALYTHYYAALTLIVTTLYGLGRRWTLPKPTRSAWRSFLLAQAAIGLLGLPWLARVIRIGEYTSPLPPVPVSVRELVETYTFGATLPETPRAWLTVAALAIYIPGLWSLARRWRAKEQRPGVILIGLALVIPGLVVLALQVGGSVVHPRYFSAMTPLYSLLLAAGVLGLARRLPLVGLGALAFLVGASAYSLNLWYTDPAYLKAYHKDYITYILSRATPNDALFLDGPELQRARRYGSDQLARVVNLQGRLRERSPDEMDRLMAEVAAEHPSIWLALKRPETGGQAKVWLDAHGYETLVYSLGDYRVLNYIVPPPLPPLGPPAGVVQPGPVGLQWAAAPGAARAGEIVAVELQWTFSQPVEPDLKTSLRLYDMGDKPLWQRDRDLGGGNLDTLTSDERPTITDRLGIRLPGDLPPGVYTLRVVLYHYGTLTEQYHATLGVVRVIAP